MKEQFPDDPAMWLPKCPVRRWHYVHALGYLRDPEVLQTMKAVSRQGATHLAKEIGLFNENEPALKGRVGVREVNDRGEVMLLPLERFKTERRGGASGFRFYGEYAVPPDYHASKPLRLRLHGNDDDSRRDLNRTEHLRAIPPGDKAFQNLNRRRNDAESINRALEDTFY